jgi:hypothetical protein
MTLDDYRTRLDGVATVDVALVHEILDLAETEIEQAQGEYTLAQAVALSGRSRSYFERRLGVWAEQRVARKAGTVWLIRRAAIPDARPGLGPYSPDQAADQIADDLLRAG